MKKVVMAVAAVALIAGFAGCKKKAGDNSLAELKERGKFILGLDASFPPMGSIDDDGVIVGYDIDLGKEVAKRLGVDFVAQPINWDAKSFELDSGNIDCIWNGMTITEERAANMSISTPYLENRQVLVVKAENKDKFEASLDGANVIAETGSAGEELMGADEAFANATCTPVASQATALMDVAAGTSDVAVIDYVMAGGSVGAGTDYEDLIIIDKNFASEEYGIAFRKGSNVTAEVNAIITEMMQDGSLLVIADKYGLMNILIAK